MQVILIMALIFVIVWALCVAGAPWIVGRLIKRVFYDIPKNIINRPTTYKCNVYKFGEATKCNLTDEEIINSIDMGYAVESLCDAEKLIVQRYKYMGVDKKMKRQDLEDEKFQRSRSKEMEQYDINEMARDMNAMHNTRMEHDQETAYEVFLRRKKG